jgi:hypothetical protein
VVNPTDSDADGLTDGVEVNDLGLLPDEDDSDGDLIADLLEVEGFTYNGAQWYLDGYEADTNSDGLTDGMECLVWTKTSATYDPPRSAPTWTATARPISSTWTTTGWHQRRGRQFPQRRDQPDLQRRQPAETDDQQPPLNKPVYVISRSARPTPPRSTTRTVLDWPSGEDAGQIQRRLIRPSPTPPIYRPAQHRRQRANGDIRLVPMLQIRMPYTSGHYSNLPVNTPTWG